LNVQTEAPHKAGMVKVQVDAWKCERCEHVWLPRDPDTKPRVCPKCKSPYWDRPRRAKPGPQPSQTA
jgi:predicted Zn-ribbon and HTH transcriptional regulator